MDMMKLLMEAQRYSEEMSKVFLSEFQTLFQEYDLSSKQSLVLNLLKDTERFTMNEIAQIINATPSAASQFVKVLEEKKYVKRETNKENRREIFVYLDEKALEFFMELEQAERRVLEKYFMKLSPEDIVVYHDVLKKLSDIVKEEE
ncbi:DNA-binding MarR family transcriptional regulator [Bacillus sp. SORGH_AS 510]|uniref:MarR family winged helix-turn-helix transcriptional regulator n=1 Tax=Bacillus sp. SORGH_AS_0510 TaxID=3041771 RepID=UPI002783A23D|nr:MarR family transcriptional regulator [Bacillus sp. SORGH_AS_0510]MDQ1146007.1 DNA-binding MarR family transcriptional regulator [Bacillus sp. SORGH_AS_0510]